jgi:hypothetical protein
MTGLIVLCLCVIITSFVLAYGSGNVPGTTPSLNKKAKALIQAIVDSDAKPSTCENLAKFLSENENEDAGNTDLGEMTDKERKIIDIIYKSKTNVCIGRDMVDEHKVVSDRILNATEGFDITTDCDELKIMKEKRISDDTSLPVWVWDKDKDEFIDVKDYISSEEVETSCTNASVEEIVDDAEEIVDINALETELATAQADLTTEEGKASPDTDKVTTLGTTITDLETQIAEAVAAAADTVEAATDDTAEAEDTAESAATDDTTANDMNV